MRTSYSPPSNFKSALAQWGLWVALSAAGLSLGQALFIAAIPLIKINPGSSTMGDILARIIVFGLLQALPYGFAQWLFLRSLRGLWLWPLVTVVTYPLIAFTITFAGLGVGNIIDTSAGEQFGLIFFQFVTLAFGTSLYSIPMGLVQWPLLRKHFKRAALWIPASYGAWLVAILALYVATFFAARSVSGIWFSVLLGAVLGGVQAAISGAVLLSLQSRPSSPTLGDHGVDDPAR